MGGLFCGTLYRQHIPLEKKVKSTQTQHNIVVSSTYRCQDLCLIVSLCRSRDNPGMYYVNTLSTTYVLRMYSCGHNLSGRIHTSITVEPYRSMLGYAFSVSLGRTPHSLLMLTYFQLCTRWAPYLEAHTQYIVVDICHV
jgi:hypothetical protein